MNADFLFGLMLGVALSFLAAGMISKALNDGRAEGRREALKEIKEKGPK